MRYEAVKVNEATEVVEAVEVIEAAEVNSKAWKITTEDFRVIQL